MMPRAPGALNMLVAVEPLNVSEYERLAAERLEPVAHGYFAGGANDELTLAANVDGLRPLGAARPRVLVDRRRPLDRGRRCSGRKWRCRC